MKNPTTLYGAIWSAIVQGLDVRVIPTTSATGPAENSAVTLVDHDAVNLQWA